MFATRPGRPADGSGDWDQRGDAGNAGHGSETLLALDTRTPMPSSVKLPFGHGGETASHHTLHVVVTVQQLPCFARPRPWPWCTARTLSGWKRVGQADSQALACLCALISMLDGIGAEGCADEPAVDWKSVLCQTRRSATLDGGACMAGFGWS